MPSDRVRIDELRLRLPLGTRTDARALGELVAQRLARSLPDSSRDRHLGALRLRVPESAGDTLDALADRIVAAIVRGLR